MPKLSTVPSPNFASNISEFEHWFFLMISKGNKNSLEFAYYLKRNLAAIPNETGTS